MKKQSDIIVIIVLYCIYSSSIYYLSLTRKKHSK